MSRVSFKEFSAGLPVKQVNPKGPRIPEEQENQTGILGRVISDVPSDAVESFKNSVGVIADTGRNIKRAFTQPDLTIPQRVGGALVAPFEGAVNLAATGVQGAAKLLTTDDFEKELTSAINEAGQKVMSTDTARRMVAAYNALPEDQKYTLSRIIAPMGSVMTAGIGGMAAKPLTSSTLRALESTLKVPLKRTAREAAEDVLSRSNPAPATPNTPNPVVDTIKGMTTQIKDFASRTAREARETAQQSRELAQMPEPKAKLIKYGADERVVNVIDKSTPEEVKVIRELVDQAKKKEADPTPNTPQPKVIAGREFLKPVDYIINERKSVGARLGEYRKGLSATRDIDTNPAFRNFHDHLKTNYGVEFDKKGKIIPNTGTLATSDLPQIQKLYDQLRSDKKNSQVELDQWLQRTYKDYDLVQKREQTFSEEVTRIADFARSQVRQLMPEDYNNLATEYARLSGPLTDFVKLIGYKGDLDKLTAKELKTGEVALRVLGNAADRPQSVIDNVLETATEYGYRSNIDLNRLIYITDQLEDLYDITPSRGFSGSATRGINQSTVGVAGDIATFNAGSLFDRAMASRASQKEIQEAFEAYVKYLDEGGRLEEQSFKKGETPETTTKVEENKVLLNDFRKQAEAKVALGAEAKQFIDNEASAIIAAIPNTKLATAPLKKVDRIVEKAYLDYRESGGVNVIKDIARNTIVAFDNNARQAAINTLSKRTDLLGAPKIQRPEQYMGYEGAIVNVVAPNGLFSEIQVVSPQMIFGKQLPKDAEAILGKELFDRIQRETGLEPGLGHKIYEDARALSEKDADYSTKIAELDKQSRQYYDALRAFNLQ